MRAAVAAAAAKAISYGVGGANLSVRRARLCASSSSVAAAAVGPWLGTCGEASAGDGPPIASALRSCRLRGSGVRCAPTQCAIASWSACVPAQGSGPTCVKQPDAGWPIGVSPSSTQSAARSPGAGAVGASVASSWAGGLVLRRSIAAAAENPGRVPCRRCVPRLCLCPFPLPCPYLHHCRLGAVHRPRARACRGHCARRPAP